MLIYLSDSNWKRKTIMFTLTTMTNKAKRCLVSFVLLAGLAIPAHADSNIGIDLSHHLEKTMTTQMDEAVDSLKSELSLLIQLQMAEMLFDHEFGSILDTAPKTVSDDAEGNAWEQE